MILADTSVIIAYLRTADPKLLAILKQHGAVICGITRAEVLYGVRAVSPLAQTIVERRSHRTCHRHQPKYRH
ncbi:MAG: hypothetical protein L0211_10930 [Planctomycetaceae bacterium]|nr:hypothetical protein [Planctomycetaceae bacterium]